MQGKVIDMSLLVVVCHPWDSSTGTMSSLVVVCHPWGSSTGTMFQLFFVSNRLHTFALEKIHLRVGSQLLLLIKNLLLLKPSFTHIYCIYFMGHTRNTWVILVIYYYLLHIFHVFRFLANYCSRVIISISEWDGPVKSLFHVNSILATTLCYWEQIHLFFLRWVYLGFIVYHNNG